MTYTLRPHNLDEPIVAYIRKDFPYLLAGMTVETALTTIREHGIGEKIIYFYVLDDEDRVVGVLPTRRLLSEALNARLSDIMVERVIAIPHTATLYEACEFFVMYKFFAFPIINEERRIIGMIDIGLFTEEMLNIAGGERKTDPVFEALGIRLSQIKNASPLKAFRFRFPWLAATIGSGLLCALLSSVFEITLAQSLVLAFFLTLVLGLGESVSIQSMTVAIQSLHSIKPTRRWYGKEFRRELFTALLLGGACGLVTGVLVFIWRSELWPGLAIGSGIFLSITAAGLLGLSIPTLLHALRLDLKIGAGPITLAITDLCTLLFYFSLAALII